MTTDPIDLIAEMDGVFLPAEGTWADMLWWCGWFVEKVEAWCAVELARGESDTSYTYCPELLGVPLEDVNAGLAPRVLADYLRTKGV